MNVGAFFAMYAVQASFQAEYRRRVCYAHFNESASLMEKHKKEIYWRMSEQLPREV